jgi:hypothetical protein
MLIKILPSFSSYHLILICVAFLPILFTLSHAQLSAKQVTEQSLIASLLNGYNKIIRPNETVDIEIILFLRQLVSIDEKNQIMTSSSYIYVNWLDERFKWSPAAYANIAKVLIPAKSLWMPDLVVANSADIDQFLKMTDNLFAMVDNEGWINIILSGISLRTRCALDVHKFPFDTQK